MSKRLQVVLGDDEWRQLDETARREGITLSEWVRRALGEARRRTPGGDLGTKLAVVRAAVGHQFPTGDIDQVLDEIERGCGSPPG